jgi:undecaprenyl pyrophosphate synthase
MNFILGRIAAQAKEILPQDLVRINAQKGLTQCDEASDMKNRIRCELVQLHTVNEKNLTKKFVGRERETTQEKGIEHHPVLCRGLRDDLGAQEDDVCRGRDEPLLLGLFQI